MPVTWTKQFDSSDDGAVLTGTQLGQMQADIDNSITTTNVPNPATGDAGKMLVAKTDLTGYELSAPAAGAAIASQAEAEAAASNTVVMTPLRVKQEVQKAGAVVIPIDNGGTGQTIAQNALDALLPPQGSASGKYLTSNGVSSSWGSSPSILSAVADYGTSLTTPVARTSGLKIAYGTQVVPHDGNVAVTGLTFTSSTTYVVMVSMGTDDNTDKYTLKAVRDSGSQFRIRNTDSGTAHTVSWLAIGT